MYEAVAGAIADLGAAEIAVSKSQIAFRRRRGFAFVWRPGQYVTSDVPAVVSFRLAERLQSPRIKEVAHPSKNVWMHHIELRRPDEVDGELRRWLAAAYENAA
ncbi:hypothetical protein JNB62_00615 [Microbacterium jejuense]|uniref:DUF5655 domain-containing protein n=1 Tax=Microbacterium jejuense TaxID=1263637 RepID=A0ABS7HH42_9MICO|nr:hypothetical protein [Microbacterium jejuense]